MAHYKVEICGINTSKLPLLSNEEKKTLFDKIKKGDKKAREAYIHGNLRLVLSIIQRFNNSTENVDDLFQIGCIGLMKAIDYTECKIFNLCSTDDYWRGTALSSRQQCDSCEPFSP